MFTGIVETVGRVEESMETLGGLHLRIGSHQLDGKPPAGSSVSVNGVCLTVVEASEHWFSVEVVPETLSRTTLASLEAGSQVNLERAMEAGGRFEGHIVQGHVDGVGEVLSVVPEGEGQRIALSVPDSLAAYIVEKGSLAVDGVSLTVARLGPRFVELAVIPHTLKVTTLGLRRTGDRVNLEVDVIGKYVARLLEAGR